MATGASGAGSAGAGGWGRAWAWLPPLAFASVTALLAAVWGLDSWCQIGPAEAAAARYRAAPPCAGAPSPECRIAQPGTIAQVAWTRVGNRGQWRYTVQFPAGTRAVTLPALSRGPRDDPYPALRPGVAVAGEWYGDWVVALTSGGTTIRTEDDPDRHLAQARSARTLAALLLAGAGPLVALFGRFLLRQPRAA